MSFCHYRSDIACYHDGMSAHPQDDSWSFFTHVTLMELDADTDKDSDW